MFKWHEVWKKNSISYSEQKSINFFSIGKDKKKKNKNDWKKRKKKKSIRIEAQIVYRKLKLLLLNACDLCIFGFIFIYRLL